MIDKNTPLGVVVIQNETNNTTTVSFSYSQDCDADHFVIEVWDKHNNKWIPYDGHNGIVRKDD